MAKLIGIAFARTSDSSQTRWLFDPLKQVIHQECCLIEWLVKENGGGVGKYSHQ